MKWGSTWLIVYTRWLCDVPVSLQFASFHWSQEVFIWPDVISNSDFYFLIGYVICMSRHGIFLPIGGFPPIERSHRSFLRSVQIRWENYRVYLTCERFSESNFVNLPRASISFLHGTFSNGVNLFCFGHHQSVLGLTESTTKGSNPIVTCKSAV